METVKDRKAVHHGHNVRLGRTWKNVTQEDLAARLGIFQSDISKLETKEQIEDQILVKIATALEIPVDFFKEFQPEVAMKAYYQSESKIEITSAENSKDNILQQGEQIITNNYYPLEKLEKLYERLLKEKDKEIESLKKELKRS